MANAPDRRVAEGAQPTHGVRWTPAAIFRRASEVIRQQGVSALFFKVLGELCYRRVYVYKEILQDDVELVAARIPLSIRKLDEADLADYGAQSSSLDQLEVEERLDAGHMCHAAWSGATLVGVAWSAPGRAVINYLNVALELPEGAVYIYEVFVWPAYRRQGVARRISRERQRQLVELGYHSSYSVVMPENRAAIRLHRAMEARVVGTMRVVWCGTWKRSWLSMADKALPLPFRFAR